mgnify:CR=1 FL=1
MVSAKLLKVIEDNLAEENIALLKNLKDFISEKLGDESANIIQLIDEFESSNLNVKKSVTVKGKRKKSFYNYWLGNELSVFKEEQSKLDKDKRVSKSERMGVMSERWRNYKESPDFEKDERKWRENSDSDSSSDSDSEKEKAEKAEKKKAEKKKAEKEKAEKEKAEKEKAEKEKAEKEKAEKEKAEKAEKKDGKVSKVLLGEDDKGSENDSDDSDDDSGDESDSDNEGVKIVTLSDTDSDDDE